jgi:predicted Zn-dependent protease
MQLFNVYRRVGMNTEAEATLKRLINARPDDPDGYSLLSSYHRDNGDPEKAAAVIRQWLALHPGDRSAIRLLETLEEEAKGQGEAEEGS